MLGLRGRLFSRSAKTQDMAAVRGLAWILSGVRAQDRAGVMQEGSWLRVRVRVRVSVRAQDRAGVMQEGSWLRSAGLGLVLGLRIGLALGLGLQFADTWGVQLVQRVARRCNWVGLNGVRGRGTGEGSGNGNGNGNIKC